MYSKELLLRKKQLESLIIKIERELPRMKEGRIRIAGKGKYAQFFLVTQDGDMKGKYMSVKEREKARELIKRDYYVKLLREAKREAGAIERYLKRMEGKSPEEVYESLNIVRQEMIEPLIISNEMYAREWESAPYEKNSFKPEECIYDTKKGEKVRSKSEAFIANIYYELGIPYRYEAEHKLKNGKVKYPDFTVLKVSERKLIYHEHLGMMDIEDYRTANFEKIREYMNSGIYTGENLILTFETASIPLDINGIKKMISEMFLP